MALDNARSTSGTSLPSRATDRGMNAIDWIALVLMIVGGINWGLIGFFNFDLVASLFGQMTAVSRAVYALVGVAAVYGIVLAVKQSTNNNHA